MLTLHLLKFAYFILSYLAKLGFSRLGFLTVPNLQVLITLVTTINNAGATFHFITQLSQF